MTGSAVDLQRTPLYEEHLEVGARMVPFAGWQMPLQYPEGIISEVRSVRTAAGMFDVSHMARLEISGSGSTAFLDSIVSTDAPSIPENRARYHVICDATGGIIDDAILYRLAEDEWLLVVNAGNTAGVLDWINPIAGAMGGVTISNTTAQTAMIAVQGPRAVEIVDGLCPLPASSVRPFRIAWAEVAGKPARIARTGYTGEDGFEIMPFARDAPAVWRRLAEAGVAPCGLGARDVLRLEAGLMLHGVDMTVDNNPYEAGLERFVDPDRAGYVAADALRQIRDNGTPRIIAGFRMTGRGIPRHGQQILKDGRPAGIVTSGTHSPTLDTNIGIGYVDRRSAAPGTTLEVDIRGRLVAAEIVPLPFYSRRRSGS